MERVEGKGRWRCKLGSKVYLSGVRDLLTSQYLEHSTQLVTHHQERPANDQKFTLVSIEE